MGIYIVNQGDCLSSIAWKFGFSDWNTIYNHSQNASFKKKRPNPNIIAPGDEIFIPEKQPKDESAQSDQSHTYALTSAPGKTYLRVVVEDGGGNPIADKEYILEVGDELIEGKTGQNGLVESEIPPDTQSGVLTVMLADEMELVYDLDIGHLDPVDKISGVKARLNSLGYDCGPADDEENEQLTEAITLFQSESGMTVTGTINDDLRKKLAQLYDKS